ncbi:MULTISPECIES: helix-turn-helix transcriptional regulator [unclassified Acinetobacter]|uniref:helix-turn-helix transcriptional regulator n=1 Tax=unclassified Acinetobacter TaxID=196816 RepID=UPI00244AFD52|nr:MULTISPECIES: helix-turn-helix transcriptional regulator [unclassified Acinetobacter]MDH0031208.1 helix-turn-helix transcriptional regulator [Acinetobacter sp. GD04021]MDH0886953.1 helix-turn-helix transcriptional regulator [Acinetobacter sp. GD03873]MDH1083404.1 helix-turn-helix transcriptional regulator [Acinetobacter sp. GD03983]MDH2190269.1 helix-turn-helix transcriptional regulator [Acinetobacter sp. GD03645]MDH2203788.1 helix-turn-helix transcriptional regulator [Acinetobacter sp. GD0
MDLLENYYNELCELIYQIPLNKDGWFNFSKELLKILNVSYVHIQAIDFSYNVLSFSNGVGSLPLEAYASAELDYLRYPTEADPRWGKFLDPERKGWYQCHTHVPEEFVENSDLYQKILLPYGLRYVATHELIWDEKLCVFWSISTSQQRQPLNPQELEFLDRLLPHLKRIVMAQRHLYEFSLDNIVGYNLIDKLNQPIMLLNLSGQVVHNNPMMDVFLEENEWVQVIDQRLTLPEKDQVQFLEKLYQIEEAFRYKQAQLEQYKDIKFLIAGTERSLSCTINLLASEKEMSFFGIRPLVMLSFDDVPMALRDEQENKQKYHLNHKYLKQTYNLTKRELELCDLFVMGINLEQVAEQMGLTRSSIRTYLRNIFAKTPCSSQVELMQLLMSIRSSY